MKSDPYNADPELSWTAIILSAAVLLMLALVASAEGLKTTVISVYDGDTITVDAVRLLVSSEGQRLLDSKTSVRVCCMDTPERGWRAQCESEREQAEASRDFVLSLMGDEIELHDIGLEKYGRVLARVWIPADELWLDERMIELGLARPYDGKVRESWCE